MNQVHADVASGCPAAIWPGRFTGQVVLVTGAAGGLGAPTCRRIAEEGATVICTDVDASGDGSSPDRCLPLDVTDRSSWNSVVRAIVAEHRRLDGALLAHAGADQLRRWKKCRLRIGRKRSPSTWTGAFMAWQRSSP